MDLAEVRDRGLERSGEHHPRSPRFAETGRGHAVWMLWKRMTTFWLGFDWPGPPWQWLQARAKTAFPVISSAVSTGSA